MLQFGNVSVNQKLPGWSLGNNNYNYINTTTATTTSTITATRNNTIINNTNNSTPTTTTTTTNINNNYKNSCFRGNDNNYGNKNDSSSINSSNNNNNNTNKKHKCEQMSQAVSNRTGVTKCRVSVTTNTATTTTTIATAITTTPPNLDTDNNNLINTAANSNTFNNNTSTLLTTTNTTITTTPTATSTYTISSSNNNSSNTTNTCSSGSIISSNNNSGSSSSSISDCGGTGFGGSGKSGIYRFSEPSVVTALKIAEPVSPLLAAVGVKPPPTRQARNGVVRSPNSCTVITATNNNNTSSTVAANTSISSNCKSKCSSFVDIYKKQLAFLVQQSGDSKSSGTGSSKKPTEPLEKKKRGADTVTPTSTPGPAPIPSFLLPLQPPSLPSPLQAPPLPTAVVECHQVVTGSNNSAVIHSDISSNNCNNGRKTNDPHCKEVTSSQSLSDLLPSTSSITTTPSPSPAVLLLPLTSSLLSLTDEEDSCCTTRNRCSHCSSNSSSSSSSSYNKNNIDTISTTPNHNHHHNNNNSNTDTTVCFDHLSTTTTSEDNKLSIENTNNNSSSSSTRTKSGQYPDHHNNHLSKDTLHNNSSSSSSSSESFCEDQQRLVVSPPHIIDSNCDGSKTKIFQQQQQQLLQLQAELQQQQQQLQTEQLLQEQPMPPTAKHLVATTRRTAIAAAAVNRSSRATSDKELHALLSTTSSAAATVSHLLQQDDRIRRNVLPTTTAPPLSPPSSSSTKAARATTTIAAAAPVISSSSSPITAKTTAAATSAVVVVTAGSASAVAVSTPAVSVTATSITAAVSSSSSIAQPHNQRIICALNNNGTTTNSINNSRNNTNINTATTGRTLRAEGDVHLAVTSVEGGMSRKRSAAGTTAESSGTSSVKRMMCKVSSNTSGGSGGVGGGSSGNGSNRDTGVVVVAPNFPAPSDTVADESARSCSVLTDKSDPKVAITASSAITEVTSDTTTAHDFSTVALPGPTLTQNVVDSVTHLANIGSISYGNNCSSSNINNHQNNICSNQNIDKLQAGIGFTSTTGLTTNTATETTTSTTAITPTLNNDSNILATNTATVCSLSSCIDTGSNSCLDNEVGYEAQQSPPPLQQQKQLSPTPLQQEQLSLPPPLQQKQLSPPPLQQQKQLLSPTLQHKQLLPLPQQQLSPPPQPQQQQLSPPPQPQQQQLSPLQQKQLSSTPLQQKLPPPSIQLQQQAQLLPLLQPQEQPPFLSSQQPQLQQIPTPEKFQQQPQPPQEDRENKVVLVPVSNGAIVNQQQQSHLLMMLHQKCNIDSNIRNSITSSNSIARLAAATNITTTNVSTTSTLTTVTMNDTNTNTSRIISSAPPPLSLQCSQSLPPLSAPLTTATATSSNHIFDTFLSPPQTDSTIVPFTNSTCSFSTSLSSSSSSSSLSSSSSPSTSSLSSPALLSLLPLSSIVPSSQVVNVTLQNTSKKQTNSILTSRDTSLFVSRSNAEHSVQSAMVMPPSTPIQCQVMSTAEAASSDCSSDENFYDDCASSEPSSKPDVDSPESFVASTQTGFDNSEQDESTEDSIGNSASYTGMSSSVYAKDISKVLDCHYKRIKGPVLKNTYDMEYKSMKLCQDFCINDSSKSKTLSFARDVLLHSTVDRMCKSYDDDDDDDHGEDDDNVYKCSFSLQSKKNIDALDCKKNSPTSGLVSDLLRCTTAIAVDHSYCWSVSKTQEPESLLRDAHPCDDEVSDSSSLDDIPDKQEHLTFLTQNTFLKNNNPKSVEMKTSFFSPASQSIRKQIVGKDRKMQLNLNSGCVSLDSSGVNGCRNSNNFKMATNATNMLCKTIPNNLINNNDNNIINNNSSCSSSFSNDNNNNNNNVVDSIMSNGDKFVTDFSSSGLEQKTHLGFNSYCPFESKLADERKVNGLSSPVQLSELSPNSRSPKITPLKNVNNRINTQNSPKIGCYRIGTYGSISNKDWEENIDSDASLAVGSISMSDKKREKFTFSHKKDFSDRLSANDDQKNTCRLNENSLDVDDTVKALSSDDLNGLKLQEESTSCINYAHILHDHDYFIRTPTSPTKSELAKELLFSSKLLPSTSSKISSLSSTKTTTVPNNSSSSPTNIPATTEPKSWRKARNSAIKSVDIPEPMSVSNLPVKIEEPDQESAETSDETSHTNESKLKITGSFQNDYVYFLNKTARSRRRFSHEILPDKNLQSKNYSDIVIPHLTDADIEALKRRQNKSSPMLDASIASKNPCEGSNDMEIDSKLIRSVMNMDNPSMDPDMEYTLPGLDNGFVSEGMSTNSEVCFTAEDMDILYSAFKAVENANGFRSLDEIRKTADSFDGMQKQINSSVSMLQEDQINPCMTAINETKEPFVNTDCMSSEEANSESAQVHAHGLPSDNNLLDFDNMPISDMHNMISNERDKFKAPILACSQEADLNQSDLNNLCSSNPSANLTDLQIPSLEKFDLLSGDLPLKLDKPDLFLEPTVEELSTVSDCNPPWIVTVTMFWNDLPAIMMDHHPYIRLVDIHKQILPAKDTGILKKRCQLLGLPVQNCTEFQRYFLVQYGRAYNSKSTLVISKDDAKSLIGYYVNPPPRAPKGECSEDEHGSPEKRIPKTNGSLEGRMKKQAKSIGSKRHSMHKKNPSLENQPNRERTLSEKSDEQSAEKQSASPTRFDSTAVSEVATSTASAATKVHVTSSPLPLTNTRSRLRHKKINFLDLIRGESGSSATALLPPPSLSSSVVAVAPTSCGSADISPSVDTTTIHSLRSSSFSSSPPSSSSSSSSSTLSALLPPLSSSLSPPSSPSSNSVLSSNKMHGSVTLAGEDASCTRKQGPAVGANRLKNEKSFAGTRQKNGNKAQMMSTLLLLQQQQQQQQLSSLLTSECNSSLRSSPDAINNNSSSGNIKVSKVKKPQNDCKLVNAGGGGGGRRCYNQKTGLNGRRQKNGDEKELAGSHCVGKLPAKISKWAKPPRGIGRRIKKNNNGRLKVKLKLQTPNHSLSGSTNDFSYFNSTISNTNFNNNYNNSNNHINKNISKNRNITNNNHNNNNNSSSRSTTTITTTKSISATKTLTTTMPISTTTTTTTNNSSKPPSHKKRLRVNKMQSIYDVIDVLREDVVAGKCMGVQAGELLTNLYIDRDSKCIRCTTCTELFSIVHFMQHHQHSNSNSGASCHSNLPLSASPLSQQQQQLSSPFLSSSSSLSTTTTSLPPSLPSPDTVGELSSTPCTWRLKLSSDTSDSQQKLWKHFLKKQHQLHGRQQSPSKSGNGIRFYTSANMLLLKSQPPNLKQSGTNANSTSRVSSRKRKQKQFYPIENYEFRTSLGSAVHNRNSTGTTGSEQSSRHYSGAVVKTPAAGRAISCSMGLSPSKKTMKLLHQPCEGASMSMSSAPGLAKAAILPGVSGSPALFSMSQTLNPMVTAQKKNRNNKSNTTTNKNNTTTSKSNTTTSKSNITTNKNNTTTNKNNTTTNKNNTTINKNNTTTNKNNTTTNKNNTTTNKNNTTTNKNKTTTNNNSSSSSLSENVVTLKNEPELLNFTALQTDDYDM